MKSHYGKKGAQEKARERRRRKLKKGVEQKKPTTEIVQKGALENALINDVTLHNQGTLKMPFGIKLVFVAS